MDSIDILKRLFSDKDPLSAWSDFLDVYSGFILKIIWTKERDYDKAMEKYLYVCSKLYEDDFSALKKYQKDYSDDPDAFLPWFKVVIRNLCIDLHRKNHGRKRYPKLLQSMSEIERKFFELYFWKGFELDEIDKEFTISGLSGNRSAAEILHDIEAAYLDSKLSTPGREQKNHHQPYFENYNYKDSNSAFVSDLENFFVYWIPQLPLKERLVLKLRFWEDATPLEIAEILQINPPNKVYKILKKGLFQLRKFYLNE